MLNKFDVFGWNRLTIPNLDRCVCYSVQNWPISFRTTYKRSRVSCPRISQLRRTALLGHWIDAYVPTYISSTSFHYFFLSIFLSPFFPYNSFSCYFFSSVSSDTRSFVSIFFAYKEKYPLTIFCCEGCTAVINNEIIWIDIKLAENIFRIDLKKCNLSNLSWQHFKP